MAFDSSISNRLNYMITAVLLIAVAALLAWLSARLVIESDWTAAGRHTLSSTSVQVLGQMTEALAITAYAREQADLRAVIRKFVARYQRVKPDIELMFVNPDAVPDEVRKLGISTNGELVLHYQGRQENVRSDSEREFTNALQRLLRTSERWLAFLAGHGERDPLGRANHDLGHWAQQLRNRGFRLQPLNLGTTPTIPDNTAVLVIAGPRVPLLPGEVETVLGYVARGGNLLWLRDPGEENGLADLAAALSIRFPAGVIIDIAGQILGVDDATIALITSSLYGSHPALRNFSLTTFYPKAGAILTAESGAWRSVPLLSSGTHTWLETGDLSGEVSFDPDTENKGPFTVGLALQRDLQLDQSTTTGQRVIVLSDGDFLSNTYVGNAGNLELGLRLVNWLSNEDDFFQIQGPVIADAHFEMPPVVAGVLGIFFLLILPLALIVTGGLVWWRRNKR